MCQRVGSGLCRTFKHLYRGMLQVFSGLPASRDPAAYAQGPAGDMEYMEAPADAEDYRRVSAPPAMNLRIAPKTNKEKWDPVPQETP